MSEQELVKELLAKLATELDATGGQGSGAICLDAIAALENLERLQPPADARERPG